MLAFGGCYRHGRRRRRRPRRHRVRRAWVPVGLRVSRPGANKSTRLCTFTQTAENTRVAMTIGEWRRYDLFRMFAVVDGGGITYQVCSSRLVALNFLMICVSIILYISNANGSTLFRQHNPSSPLSVTVKYHPPSSFSIIIATIMRLN